MEEYLLSLILQSESVDDHFKLSNEILEDYEFELPSYKKIFENLKSYFINNPNFSIKLFAKALPKETIALFDTRYILPLPKFEEQDKYTQEIEKVVKELKVLDLKNKIKVIAQAINKKEKDRKKH